MKLSYNFQQIKFQIFNKFLYNVINTETTMTPRVSNCIPNMMLSYYYFCKRHFRACHYFLAARARGPARERQFDIWLGAMRWEMAEVAQLRWNEGCGANGNTSLSSPLSFPRFPFDDVRGEDSSGGELQLFSCWTLLNKRFPRVTPQSTFGAFNFLNTCKANCIFGSLQLKVGRQEGRAFVEAEAE